jgi:hypothetical protein
VTVKENGQRPRNFFAIGALYTTASARVAKAEIEAFNARLEAIDAILHDASSDDVLTLCAQALAAIAPSCCETHQDEFKTELLRVSGDCVTVRQEQEEAESGGDDEAHRSVH